jgi:two-component system OmpR family sensor kinase
MTAAEADATRPGHWSGRPWRALRRLSSRTSLRTKLIATLLALVIAASLAISMAGISLLRGELFSPIDSNLLAYSYGGNAWAVTHCAEQSLESNSTACGINEDLYWIGSNNQLVSIPTYESTSSNMQVGSVPAPPDLTGLTGWLQNNPRQAITVASQSGGKQWRVMSFAAPDGTGMVVVAQDATSAYSTLRQLTAVDIIVSLVIIVILALVGFAVVQSNLRPLVEIEETAEEIADGHLNRRVPERDPRTEIGSLGRSLNIMLSQIEAAFHAREESEAAAHQSEERMRRFIADASHELRTPLTAIRGFAEYYRQRGGMVSHWDRAETDGAGAAGTQALGGGMNPDDLDRIMQRVEKEAARMGVLVEDLLLLARLDQQRPLARQPVDLLSLAADAVHDARLLSPSRSIELSVQPGAAFLIEGDEVRLRQVIGNLMSNALTHTPDGTAIEVTIGSGILDPRVGDSPPAVIVDVTDHGPGMTSEQAHRVFERFYRADQARTRATGGSGLGLAIVSALVSAHGGVASVRTAPGRGATFRIALPLAAEAQGSLPDEDEAEPFGVMEERDITDGADDASVTYGTKVDAWGDAAGADAMAEAAGAEDDGARLSHQS